MFFNNQVLLETKLTNQAKIQTVLKCLMHHLLPDMLTSEATCFASSPVQFTFQENDRLPLKMYPEKTRKVTSESTLSEAPLFICNK